MDGGALLDVVDVVIHGVTTASVSHLDVAMRHFLSPMSVFLFVCFFFRYLFSIGSGYCFLCVCVRGTGSSPEGVGGGLVVGGATGGERERERETRSHLSIS